MENDTLTLFFNPLQIKVLNDSREVVITLYVTSVILALVVIVSLAVPQHLNVYSACYSLGIPIASTVVLIVVFFSKVGGSGHGGGGCILFVHTIRMHSQHVFTI